MSRNPVIPYAIIAALGILAVIIISYLGANQRLAIEEDNNDNGEEATEEVEEGETAMDAEDIFKNSCANCHGDDLSGEGSNPDLTEVGSRLSAEEIEEIINEGQGDMPAEMASPEEAEVLAEWLEEEHN